MNGTDASPIGSPAGRIVLDVLRRSPLAAALSHHVAPGPRRGWS